MMRRHLRRKRLWRLLPLVVLLLIVWGAVGSYAATNTVPTTYAADGFIPLSASQLAPPECYGIAFADVLIVSSSGTGTAGNDLILGNASDNTIYGGGGDDCIVAGAGRDYVDGGDGNDVILGGSGDEGEWINLFFFRIPWRAYLRGGNGNDIIYGEGGDDILDGGSGTDTLNGGSGYDACFNGESNSNCEW